MRRLLAIPLFASLAAAALAATPAWRVRARVTVTQSVVRLGDLVVPAPPEPLRQLVLAAAPQPGIPLRWSRQQFTSRLRSAGVALAGYQIPAHIEIQRQAQPVPTAAVLAALTTFLNRPVSAAELRFTPPLTTAADPAVKVLRAIPDAVHGRLELICRAQHDPLLLPFAVSVRASATELARRASAGWRFQAAQQRPILVKPGRMAQLTIAQPGFALTTLVQPLQAGRKGDAIHVRSLATKAILQVVVTGTDQVGARPYALALLPRTGAAPAAPTGLGLRAPSPVERQAGRAAGKPRGVPRQQWKGAYGSR